MSLNPPLLSTSELHENLSKYVIIDVRSDHEWFGELGHIEGSKLVTLGEALTDYIKNCSKGPSYAFICRSGNRSNKAAKEAVNKGLIAFNVAGGMLKWNENNYLVTKAPLS